MKVLSTATVCTTPFGKSIAPSCLGFALATCGCFSNGWAQELPTARSEVPQDVKMEALDEVIVTGTFIRGIAPGGSQTLSISAADAVAAGAASTSQLLANIPQDNSFAGRPANGAFGSTLSVNRPTLRYLGGQSAGGSSTLLLVDGHRLPGMGVRQTTPDLDAIAPGAIESVEIVTDGGSSTYGADAVGGVMNFVTRKRFDGAEIKGRYGLADDYWMWDTSATVGKEWDRGSAWISYNFAEHDELYGSERDFAQRRDWELGAPLDLTCQPGNAVIGSTIYSLPSMAIGGGNRCDIGDAKNIFPKERRHSVFAALNLDVTDAITADVRAFYMNRDNRWDNGPFTASVTLSPVSTVSFGGQTFTFPNPYYQNTGDANAGRPQSVSFDFSPVFGPHTYLRTELETWGVSPTLTAELGGDWQLRLLLNYGEGTSESVGPTLDNLALATAAFLGQFDPYNLAAPVNASTLARMATFTDYGKGVNKLYNARLVADGALFSLPGGNVRLALGAEGMREEYEVELGQVPASSLANLPTYEDERRTKAAFAELSIPVVGVGNRATGVHSLTLSAAGRYDDYSDFGDTFNPKLGLTYEPVEWIALRGTWGKSFQAPSLSDGDRANPAQINSLPAVIFPAPGVPALPGQVQIFLAGGGSDLEPQRATTWSIGTDIAPPAIDGLSFNLNYYKVEFEGRISLPPVFNPSLFYSQFPDNYKLYSEAGGITAADIQEHAALATNPEQIAPYIANPSLVYSIGDARNANLSSVITSGLDFGVLYDRLTGFGSVFGSISGNYLLTYEEQASSTAPLNDNIDLVARLRVATTIGARLGNLLAQATWQHSGGFDVTPTASNLNQSRIGSFNPINLFLKYDVVGAGQLNGVSVTLNVDNVFDKDPPLYRGTLNQTDGYVGFTLGRLVQLGIVKEF